jgi:hypothetical protein
MVGSVVVEMGRMVHQTTVTICTMTIRPAPVRSTVLSTGTNWLCSVQTKLASKVYYRGQVDGVIGSGQYCGDPTVPGGPWIVSHREDDPKLLKSLASPIRRQPGRELKSLD